MNFMTIGLMTGSSMDGIDAVLMETDGQRLAQPLHGASFSYDACFHKLLRSAEYALQAESGNLEQADLNFTRHLETYLSLNPDNVEKNYNSDFRNSLNLPSSQDITLTAIVHKLTLLHKDLIEKLLNEASLPGDKIDVVGFHGQNLYHNPAQKITFQAGNGQLLANETGIFVINDFRRNDVENGGQGAPFAPLYHQMLALNAGLVPIGIVNCGGITNISLITGKDPENITGYDAGPGNVLLDRYVRQKTGYREFMDRDGKYAKSGKVIPEIMELLQEKAIDYEGENFLAKTPPKSLDALNFNLIPELNALSMEDACATLAAFSARCIVDSLNLVSCPIPPTWALVGGGWNNPVITHYFQLYLREKLGDNIKIMQERETGWNPQYLEPEIFAWLAVRSLRKMPLSYPCITGVSQPVCGGRGYIPLHIELI